MSYWEKRQEETYRAGEMTVNQYFKGLEKSFNQAKQELQKTVESFYWRYAEENGLTYAAAQKRLDKMELKGLRDFVDKAMKNIGKYNQDVNNMSIKARMTRYQALEAQVDAILRELYAVDYQADAEEMMSGLYQETYHRTWYDADRYRGFHAQFAQIEPRTMEIVLKYPFNGANFSDRLWKQKEHLQSQLMESITTMMVQGTSPQNLAKDFAKKMQAKKFDAYRLLHTEGSYVMSEATHAGYKEDGVEQYQILATLDSKTCGICGRLDRKIYPVAEAVTGKNMPPFHPFCRCTDVPYYPDTPTDGKRAARDADGNGIEVPENMTYAEWKIKYLHIEKENVSDIINLTDKEQQALNQYVSFDFYPINAKIREGLQLTERELQMVSNLDAALEKIPRYKGSLSRSLYFGHPDLVKKFLDGIKIGGEIGFQEFLSTTCGAELYNPDGEIQIFIQNATKGHDITSINKRELEVLYERQQEFKVMYMTQKDGKYWILLEEL
uniref:Minor capsid protein n=1 Tax=Myoviridae sp. ctMvU7 TaxID=2826642 RepID=A0A8S5M7D0_9CAUD|nr:MAG TPA: minor capsid protein [Myoviridae sp. ctMvU7]